MQMGRGELMLKFSSDLSSKKGRPSTVTSTTAGNVGRGKELSEW